MILDASFHAFVIPNEVLNEEDIVQITKAHNFSSPEAVSYVAVKCLTTWWCYHNDLAGVLRQPITMVSRIPTCVATSKMDYWAV